jgi:hypothetical protein
MRPIELERMRLSWIELIYKAKIFTISEREV